MRASVLAPALVVAGCMGAPQLEEGQYVARSADQEVDGAIIAVDAARSQLRAIGGCSASGLNYEIKGHQLRIIGGTATASGPCPDLAADARNTALANALWEKSDLTIAVAESGFTVARGDGASIRFVPATERE